MLFLILSLVLALPTNSRHIPVNPSASSDFSRHENEICTIYTHDNEVKLVLTTHSVYMQLSDEKLDEINRDLDEDLQGVEGLGHDIAASIISGIKNLLNEKLSVEIDDIDSVYYKDSELHFDYTGYQWLTFDKIHNGDHIALSDFPREDALKFINAFNIVKESR